MHAQHACIHMHPRRPAAGSLNFSLHLDIAPLVVTTLPVCSPSRSKLLYKFDSSRPYRRAFGQPPQKILTEGRVLSCSATTQAATYSIDTAAAPGSDQKQGVQEKPQEAASGNEKVSEQVPAGNVTLHSGEESLPLLSESPEGSSTAGRPEADATSSDIPANESSANGSTSAGDTQMALPSIPDVPAPLPDLTLGAAASSPAAPAAPPPPTVPQDTAEEQSLAPGGDLPPAGQLPAHLGPGARKLLISWADKASSLGWMHHAAAEKYLFWSNTLTVASLTMGLLGGCASLINSDVQSKWVTVSVGGLNLASAAVVTMKRNFQITELSTSHNMAAKQYSAYFRAVAAEMIKHGNQIDSTFFRWAENRFNHLNTESPAVPEGVANRFYALFGEQLKHAPDIAQGLGALSVLGPDGEETSLHFADRSWLRKSGS